MKINVLTIFPEMFSGVLGSSMMKRAADAGILEFFVHNIRDYSENKHSNTDDYPFGGGAGMVMMAQPILSCMDAVDPNRRALCICMTPRGETLTTQLAYELSKSPEITLLCGHYEGIDERVMTRMHREISIGDYVLTGGELPAMVLIDCISRFIPGVLGCEESAMTESFSDGLLEYPQYTRPAEYDGMKVPDVLLSGNHANIEKWRREQSIRKTLEMRPELIDKAELSRADREYIKTLKTVKNGQKLPCKQK